MTITPVATNLYLPDPALVQSANATIAAFEQSTNPSVWPFLDKATIVQELRARVNDPFQINQGGQPFCGPASVLFELVRRQPVRYVQMCWSLFEGSGLQAKTRWIAAPKELRLDSRGDLQMSQVDWMVLATLRQSENVLFPVEPNAPELIRNLAGMTKSWEMKGWIREILGYTQVAYNHAYLMNDVSALQRSADVVNAGGIACLLITAEGMLQNKSVLVPYPSHWVTLLGNVSIGNRISFDIYTWSKKLRVELDQESFKKYFWASVTGK